MSEPINLKKTERWVFTRIFQDGLWDIRIGSYFSIFVIAPYLGDIGLGDFWSSAVFIPIWGLVFLVTYLLKKYFVTPRLGTVQFGARRKSRLIKLNLFLFIVLCTSVLLGLLVANQRGLTQIAGFPAPPLIFAGILIIVFAMAGYFLDVNRLYLYGFLAGFSPIVGEWLYRVAGAPHHGFPLTFGLTSAVITIVGVVKFIQFIIQNPIPRPEIPAEQAQNG